ncbi:hypothetical protein L210DRAFT_298164 [Boletus edulis BED1]|uniref:Uncharacterized protein n=1 Tax=Boletus edulis BED1 TaxID=1328754 RepID=A0AAD4C614_BOLED|nr:hypothetical protein L210DRAFT_298164 [Boletus edulis BED1]
MTCSCAGSVRFATHGICVCLCFHVVLFATEDSRQYACHSSGIPAEKDCKLLQDHL